MRGSNKTANLGPWLMSDSACDAWEIPSHESRTSSSCHSIVDDEGEVVAFAVTSYNEWDNPTKEAQLTANARLIAAAPELLADLTAAAAQLRKYETLHRAKNTEDSLRKAEVNAELAARFEQTIAKATS